MSNISLETHYSLTLFRKMITAVAHEELLPRFARVEPRYKQDGSLLTEAVPISGTMSSGRSGWEYKRPFNNKSIINLCELIAMWY